MRHLIQRFRDLFVIAPQHDLDLNRHRPALDGVRGLAVLLVLCYDCLKISGDGSPFTLLVRRTASAGWIGVDLFFVLSGFLITGILLETRGSAGYWKNFIARRSLRIFPLYYATLLTVFGILPIVFWFTGAPASTRQAFDAVSTDQAWYWLYLQNWLFAWRQSWPADGILKHFWSLAIEEQFYLVWPFVVAILTRRPLVWLCLSISVLSMCMRFQLISDQFPGMVGFVMTVTRMDSLCWGALLAVALRTPAWRERLTRIGPAVALFGILLLGVGDIAVGLCRSETYVAYTFGHTVIAIAFVGLITGVVAAPDSHPLVRMFSWSMLTILGKYSYAIYVFHKFIYYGLKSLDWSLLPAALQGWAIFLSTVGLSLIAARISWVVVEHPCLRLKRYFPREAAPDRDTSSVSPAASSQIVTATPLS